MKKLVVLLTIVFAIFFAQSAMAEDLKFNLYNHASVKVVSFQTSPVNDNNWGPNLMEGYELPSNGEVEVAIEDGEKVCHYDILVIFSDDSRVEDRNIDLCDLGSYTVND